MTAPYSFSKINLYRTCARQYQAKYVTKEVKFQQTPQALWGTETHAAAEHYVNESKPLPPRFEVLQPYLNIIMALPGTKRAEVEFGIKEDLSPCDFWAPDCLLRGKLDVLVDQEDKAIIADWKTGKAKPNDFEELRCFSVLTFLNKPEISKTKNTYIWLKKDSPPTTEIVQRSQINELLEPLQDTIAQIENSICYDEFKPRPSGLCQKYCDVISCRHNGRSK